MCDTPFKTPHPYMRENSEKSDSEESTTSTGTGDTGSNYSGDLSIVAAFDDLIRFVKQKRADKVENAFLQFAEDVKDLWEMGREAIKECRRLQQIVDKKTSESSDLENALKFARQRLDHEKQMTKQAERERDELERKMSQIMDIFNQKENTFSQETKEKLDNYFSTTKKSRKSFDDYAGGQLSAIQEINSTGSILSDLSITKSEDNLDDSLKKHKASFDGIQEPVHKKRRSSLNKFVEVNATDTVRATTTLTVPKEGPITATSIIESVPNNNYVQSDFPSTPTAPPANLVFESWANQHSPRITDKDHYRLHTLQPKTIVIPDNCTLCEKRIRFGKTALKCKDCRALCHLECKSKLPRPCIPQTTTPNQKNVLGIISDYTPTTPPMVPGILIHCINEIELRGLNELGIYRIPGPERDVKMLKEKFLKGRGAPSLDQIDIHVICGTVKDFLRSLNESLITFGLWRDFVAAIEGPDPQDTGPALYHAISQLPQPNRDTLAYVVLHLQRISTAPECKMPIGNLAKIFGPTIVGYSCEDPNPRNLLTETKKQVLVMEALMNIPSEYWSTFVNVTPEQNNTLRQTPSTDSLLRSTAKGSIFTPNRALCHLECKSKLALPCIPQTTTPNQKNVLGIISDYTPTTPPMVPGILIHCINEIELRGLNELGIYRIPGPERDVKMLKGKFLKGRGAPSLDQIDIHVICGTVKDFLRSLNESLITFGLWRDFVAAIEGPDPQDTAPALYHAISQLPQPNRDTLAYVVLHLQRISFAPECKMPIGNLAKIFGPTIVGYSCEDPNPRNLLTETKKQVLVMEALMNIPSEYWSTFVNVTPEQNNTLRQTPSTDSLLRSTAKGSIFTPNRNRTKRKQKFFATPPSYN